MSPTPGSRPRILAIDTATRRNVLALGRDATAVEAADTTEAGHRHGSHVLERMDALLVAAGCSLAEVEAIAVGTGPGSFTGMRVGLATAKTLAYVRSLPLVDVPTSDALRLALATAGGDPASVVVLPAGARDHYLAAPDADARLVAPGALAAAVEDRPVMTVDLPSGVLGAEAAEAGRRAIEGLPSALLALAEERLRAGRLADVETLVPVYVSLPRGVARAPEELGWSPDLR